ncbi:MAG: hypothetical protein WCQ67_01560 [Treponema sp.]
MSNYKTFKAVIFCPEPWVEEVTPEALEKQYQFFKQYVNLDKVYLESYRSGRLASKEKLLMIKIFLESKGIEVSGGFTTCTGHDQFAEKKYKSQRIFDTYCYTDKEMRSQLQSAIEFTASIFDEIILDDYYFTNCTCEDCIKAKGKRSWQEYRLALMKDVSENVIVKPAKKVNPNCKLIIKFPNWMESYAGAGYNPGEEKDIFDKVYTGTETRNMMDQDQNLPRYLSYSLMRWMENLAPGRNGGGWFDAYQCYPMEAYLEQAYLTMFAKTREVMIFCWPLVYDSYLVPTLGFQMKKIDELMQQTGSCVGLAEYHPVNAQGEDHLADYLGLLGIPFEPTPNFPSNEKAIFFTAASCADENIMSKLEEYVRKGGHAIVTSGFVQLMQGKGIEQMTSLRYRERKISANTFQFHSDDSWEEYKTFGAKEILFPLMEHRNNVSWMTLKGMTEEKNFPILINDTYGEGQMVTLVVPDNFTDLKDLPKPVLTEIRKEFCSKLPVHLDCGKNIGLFMYSNDKFITYAYEYLNEGPQPCFIHIKGDVKSIIDSKTERKILPYKTLEPPKWLNKESETIFKIETHPDIFNLWTIER